MKCVTHSMDASAPAPVGIWWITEDGSIDRYYESTAVAERQLATQVMSQRLETCKPEDYFSWLDSTSPFLHDWNEVDIEGDPVEFLALVQGVRPT